MLYMSKLGGKRMICDFERIFQDITKSRLEIYWSGFDLVAFALYDRNNVYLFNHPQFKNVNNDTFHLLKWDQQFNGDTLILYKDYPTAIVNLELHEDYASLYSTLVHELFHGYQYLKGEKRFPNEVMGMMYPLSSTNVEIRKQEREVLFNAVMASHFEEKKQYIQTFIACRKKD